MCLQNAFTRKITPTKHFLFVRANSAIQKKSVEQTFFNQHFYPEYSINVYSQGYKFHGGVKVCQSQKLSSIYVGNCIFILRSWVLFLSEFPLFLEMRSSHRTQNMHYKAYHRNNSHYNPQLFFRLTPKSIESLILMTTNSCHSADLKGPTLQLLHQLNFGAQTHHM